MLSLINRLHADWTLVNKEDYVKGIERAEDYFQNDKQSCRFRYSVFAGAGMQRPQESYEGFYIRNGAEMYSQSGVQIIYQDAERRLIVDNGAKRVVLTIPDTKDDSGIKKTVFNETLELVSAFRKKIESNKIYYKLEYPRSTGIDHQLVVLNSDGLIEEFSTYYSKELPLNPNDPKSAKVKPIVKMELYGYGFQKEITAENKIDSVLLIQAGKPALQGRLKNFELINVLG